MDTKETSIQPQGTKGLKGFLLGGATTWFLFLALLLLAAPACSSGGGTAHALSPPGDPDPGTDAPSPTEPEPEPDPKPKPKAPPKTGDIALSWEAPQQNEDGSPLDDLAGYRIYDGAQSGVYTMVTEVEDVTEATLTALPEGTYFIAVVAFDLSGNESEYSDEIVVTVP